ncbi:MAG: glycosyltransferase [Luteolibacter sp.]
MLEFFLRIAFAIYIAASAGLLVYGLNCYVLLFLFTKKSSQTRTRQIGVEKSWKPASLPKVTTQIPLYNEFNVAERVIRAVAQFDYPKDLHQIQVLDDSNDETRDLVDRICAELQEKGIQIEATRREIRQGYKAGALSDAMSSAHGEFIAIFDSDFIPAPDFLRKLLPHFEKENTGLVQARWGHINTAHSVLTKTQSVGIDGHFAIEQTARSTNHLFLNFNGTAGIWRRAAIEDAGGWTADTLTEDLDLSYRAQLKGWHLEYVPHVEVPAELPETYAAFKSQQFRWAKGSIQTAIKLLPEVLKSDRRPLAKFQSIIHLCNYAAHPLMLLLALLALPSHHFLKDIVAPLWLWIVFIPLIFSIFGPTTMYIASQRFLHPENWKQRMLLLPALILLGFGICISNTRAVLEAILGIKSGFIRTPKSGSKTTKTYNPITSITPFLEIGAAAYCLFTIVTYAQTGNYSILPFLSLYTLGFSLVGFSSLKEQLDAK